MRFVVDSSALNGDDSVLDHIDRLVDRVAEEVHRVEVPETDLLQESDWYRKARQTRRKVLTSSLARPPRVTGRGPHAKTVHVSDAASAKLADKLAHTPLVVLVEDRESDGVLLDIVVEELGWPELKRLWLDGRKTTPRALDMDTAGGKDAIPQRVERAVRDAAEEGRPPHLFVLCDSDARWPGDSHNPIVRAMNAVRAACAKHGVPHHVWQKRSAENYIPDEVLEAERDAPHNVSRRDGFNALLKRSKPQRDHFPLCDGLSDQERSEAILAGLYEPAEEEDLKLLKRSLLGRRPRPLKRLGEERRGSFTADGLQERDGEEELEALLHVIAQEL